MAWNKDVAREGETVIIWQGHQGVFFAKLAKGEYFCHRFGRFAHDDMIDKPYGSKKPPANQKKSYLFMLSVTPELWTQALEHRTQILYTLDCSLIAFHLHLKPGSVVVESGTGSGSLTTTLARTVAPHGHVHSFEFNKERVRRAKEDFEAIHPLNVVTVKHRDVVGQGFPEELDDKADALFLDLPAPQEVVHFAKKTLKNGGRFCSFSPCIEQVQRTCKVLTDSGFHNLMTFEVLVREFKQFYNRVPVLIDNDDTPNVQESPCKDSDAREEPASKKAKPNPDKDSNEVQDILKPKLDTDSNKAQEGPKPNQNNTKPCLPKQHAITELVKATKCFPEMAGHTGYLTFAYRP